MLSTGCQECARPQGSKKKSVITTITAIRKNCTGPDELKLHPLCLRDLVISLGLPAVPGSKSWISMKREGNSVKEREREEILKGGKRR